MQAYVNSLCLSEHIPFTALPEGVLLAFSHNRTRFKLAGEDE